MSLARCPLLSASNREWLRGILGRLPLGASAAWLEPSYVAASIVGCMTHVSGALPSAIRVEPRVVERQCSEVPLFYSFDVVGGR
jgi:hypothetical protein